MKGLTQAKSRLWEGVPSLQRQAVTLLMLHKVLRAIVDALGPTACQVVGGDAPVKRVVDEMGALWCKDPGTGLNDSVWVAMQEAVADGCLATMFMPGDLPLVEADDIFRLALASSDYAQPVGVMASEDGGTNALLIPTAMAFKPMLGEDSFAKHMEAVSSAGAELTALDLPNVAFDLDSFADFQWACRNAPNFIQSLDNWQARLYKERV